ncbi:MAG: glycosyltransferase family 39 protein [Chloroflexi bacterium]|nr:glycosyltransferase family 39 protein [Chloroflexota bacterium]
MSESAARALPGEQLFLALLVLVLTVTWLGVALAQFGVFSLVNTAAGAGAILALVGWWARRRIRWHLPVVGWPHVAVALPVILATVLFAQPTEHYPLIGDSAIYPNTGALLAQTAGLTYEYTPFRGLTPDEKKLFYVPSDEQIPGMVIVGYQGLLYGAYYVVDADSNHIVSSRPAGFIVWLALAFAAFGRAAVFSVTPLFGVMGVTALYLAGARLYGFRTGMLAALLLVVSFPQIHFARTPYAEAMAQALVWGGLYCVFTYLSRPRRMYLLIAAASFGAAILTRIDALASVLPALVVVFLLIARRDAWGAAIFLCWMALSIAGWLVNAMTWLAPYVLASQQLFSIYVYGFLKIWPWLAAIGGATALAVAVLLYQHGLRARDAALGLAANTFVRGLFAALVIGITLYLYFIHPVWPPVRAGIPPNDMLPRLGLYLTPLLIAAAAFGLVLCFWQSPRGHDIVLMTFTVLFAGLFLPRYTSAAVYPVALRRLTPEVIPALLLFASYFIGWAISRSFWRRMFPTTLRNAQVAVLALVMSGVLATSAPYLVYQEAQGTTQFASSLAEVFPTDAVIIFEPIGDSSQVGWFACPLWSVYGRDAVLLSKPAVDQRLLMSAVSKWLAQGRPVYFVSESEASASAPGRIRYTMTGRLRWDSSLIGQSRDLFPPFIWRFDMPFYIFRLTEQTL